MPKVLGWKIYYSDSTYDSTQGSWTNAPDNDVQVILVIFDDMTKEIISDGDWYAKTGTKIIRGHDPETLDKYPLIKQLGHDNAVPKGAKLKLGKEIELAKYEAIYNEAFNDDGEGWLSPEKKKAPEAIDHKPDGGKKAGEGRS